MASPTSGLEAHQRTDQTTGPLEPQRLPPKATLTKRRSVTLRDEGQFVGTLHICANLARAFFLEPADPLYKCFGDSSTGYRIVGVHGTQTVTGTGNFTVRIKDGKMVVEGSEFICKNCYVDT